MHPHIRKYREAHTKTITFGGSQNEQTIRHDFINLINDFADEKKLRLLPEIRDKSNNTIPDGTLKDRYQFTCGYYEAKDPKDDLQKEIHSKLQKGYSSENILFENSQTAVLYQESNEVMRINIDDDKALEKVIQKFIDFRRKDIENFQRAIDAFKEDIPKLSQNLRHLIKEAQSNTKFTQQRDHFLEQCKEEINPSMVKEDIGEMIIQHFLTGRLFQTVFSEIDFHRYNNIAQKIDSLSSLAFDREMRKDFESKNAHFYTALEAKAKGVKDHHDKQGFLKTLYEEFYKAYNPMAADKLGVVYTPNEIVQFMLKSTDYFLQNYFQTDLAQPNVNILDPATGTGTFIADLIDYLPAQNLTYKYQNEIFANEVAILPYYIAALNIEYTYQQKTQHYKEFGNIAFVDTLDNYAALNQVGKEQALKLGITEENAQRIKRQNEAKISVIIGNPPYNAKQQNYSDQNANRKYEEIDERIKKTFVHSSQVTNKMGLYDMYARFYRWAMDRLDSEKGGIVAFVTNNSFINARGFDGFRKCVFEDFDYIYIVNTKSDVRKNPKISGTKHNVFGIQTGVCIAFFIKTKIKNQRQKLFYYALEDEQTKVEKLKFLKYTPVENIPFQTIYPDKRYNWLNITDNDFDDLLPLCSKKTKKVEGHTIFQLFCRGVGTNRDAWVYDFDKQNLERKAKFLSKIYNESIQKEEINTDIKWSIDLKTSYEKKQFSRLEDKYFFKSLFRPFTKKYYYGEKLFSHELTENHHQIFGKYGELENKVIAFAHAGCNKPFHCFATNTLPDLHLTGDSQCLPFYRYNSEGQRVENITQWSLLEFQKHYKDKRISKAQIFHYVYAVLHCPKYRKTYEFDLKRDFPRIPFYEDFCTWSEVGKALMDLHIGFETVEPYPLKRIDLEIGIPKLKLKADKSAHVIFLDSQTSLSGIPKKAWDYVLGSRSALEWVLDQYKENKINDKTVAEKFNAYRFCDYKEEVILLLQKVCRVSVETVGLVDKLKQLR